jgi:hypothetical protein
MQLLFLPPEVSYQLLILQHPDSGIPTLCIIYTSLFPFPKFEIWERDIKEKHGGCT